MHPQRRPDDQRQLLRLFRKLDAPSRETLLAFARFLAARESEPADIPAVPEEPCHEPRPTEETVVSAIRRMRRTYPMLDSATMLNEASSLMTAHVVNGRAAAEVIDELENLFAARFAEHKGRSD
jgi:hypothetical protein